MEAPGNGLLPRLKVEQKVWLSQKHQPLKKTYVPGWTKEVFVVQCVIPSLVTMYQ